MPVCGGPSMTVIVFLKKKRLMELEQKIKTLSKEYRDIHGQTINKRTSKEEKILAERLEERNRLYTSLKDEGCDYQDVLIQLRTLSAMDVERRVEESLLLQSSFTGQIFRLEVWKNDLSLDYKKKTCRNSKWRFLVCWMSWKNKQKTFLGN